MYFWRRIFLNMFLFLALAGLLPSMFYISSIWIALGASVVLALFNMLIKPILSFLSFPITLLTLGLFGIVINAVMLELTSFFMNTFISAHSFTFSNFGATMLVAILLSFANSVIIGHFTDRI